MASYEVCEAPCEHCGEILKYAGRFESEPVISTTGEVADKVYQPVPMVCPACNQTTDIWHQAWPREGS